jgi:hypothetical protein
MCQIIAEKVHLIIFSALYSQYVFFLSKNESLVGKSIGISMLLLLRLVQGWSFLRVHQTYMNCRSLETHLKDVPPSIGGSGL